MVRLHYAADDPRLGDRCRVLQAEMLSWSVEYRHGPSTIYDGTFASLVRFYETHPDSPYHDLRPSTRAGYSKTMALLMRHKGKRIIATVDGADVGRWYKELEAANSRGWAYYTINVLKAVLSFGASKRIEECKVLRGEISAVRFKAGNRRKEYLTYQQVIAFNAAAKEMGLAWMGLCLLLQFDFGLRRRDVIGEYVTDETGDAAIRIGKRIWRDGITWGHIDSDGIFRKKVSKTAFTSGETAVHAVDDYPELVAELAAMPRRAGPIVLNSKTGLPPTDFQCRRAFRRVATKIGLPKNVWNMDARAGANTEAYAAGATADERLALLTHTEPETNEGYIREKIKLSRSTAAKRVASRKE